MCKPDDQEEPIATLKKDGLQEIAIRRYRPSDKEQVHQVFSAGMLSLERDLFIHTFSSPGIVAMFVGWTAVVLGAAAFGWGRLNHIEASTDLVLLRSGLASSAASAIALPVWGLYRFLCNAMRGYVQMSISDDLSKIEKVYGGRGAFLVAEMEDGSLIGTVAGEDKGDGAIELRRMSVLDRARNRGVGKGLVYALEKATQPKRMVLTTSSMQYAAHALYEKTGFTFTKVIIPEEIPFLIRVAFRVLQYEKEYS